MDKREEMFNELDEKLKAKAKAAKSAEELRGLLKGTGIELSDAELEGVVGGQSWSCITDCPKQAPFCTTIRDYG